MRLFVIMFFSVLMMSGCGGSSVDEKDPTEEVVPPTNLTVDVDVSDTGNGEVTIIASATGAKYFVFDFNEYLDLADTRVDGATATATYTYSNPGNYKITVKAHANSTKSISEKKDITVTVNQTVTIPAEGYEAADSYDGMELVWEDDFGGDAINMDNWKFEVGNGASGWGNNELEYYTAGENASIQDGNLVITAKRQDRGGYKYTSTRMITKGKQSFQYGRIDIRAVLPEGQGIWPALWMLGDNIDQVSWPRCGEIDIMEMIGGGDGRDNRVHGTPHWWNDTDPVGPANYGGHITLTSGKFKDKFHVFSVVWDEEKIVWYMDDVQYHIIDTTPARLDEFRAPFFFIFNVAVGGNWPGAPNASTKFPQHMIVDYVRVYQPVE